MDNFKRKRKEADEETILEDLVFGEEMTTISPVADVNSSAASISQRVWVDEDDNDIEVDLASKARLKKLGRKHQKQKINGLEFSDILKDRFQTRSMDWAVVEDHTFEDGLLRTASSLLAPRDYEMPRPLPSGRIQMMRKVDANVSEPSTDSISAVQFHSSGSLLLSAGRDRHLRLFKVDGDQNEKQLSVRFSDLSISNAQFVGQGSEIVLVGRKPYYYSYDTESGAVRKNMGVSARQLKSCENMALSPEGSMMSFMGTGGYAHLYSGKHKTWVGDIKMNCSMRSMVFASENTLITSGLDADVYVWDLRKVGKCLLRFGTADGSSTTSLAVSNEFGGHPTLAVGSESGVVSLYKDGVLGLESTDSTSIPLLSKSIMNLTTKVDTTVFHPSSQLLAIASKESVDELRLVHLPTNSVYSNWPTESTPLRKVQCCAFSPGGGYLAIGNNIGKVLLYRLQHFSSA